MLNGLNRPRRSHRLTRSDSFSRPRRLNRSRLNRTDFNRSDFSLSCFNRSRFTRSAHVGGRSGAGERQLFGQVLHNFYRQNPDHFLITLPTPRLPSSRSLLATLWGVFQNTVFWLAAFRRQGVGVPSQYRL